MRSFLLFFLVTASSIVHAQLKTLTIRASTNYPVIADLSGKLSINSVPIPSSSGYQTITTNVGQVHEIYSNENPGFDLTTTATFRLKSVIIETGLGIQYYRYNRSFTVTANNNVSDVINLGPRPVAIGKPFVTINSPTPTFDSNILLERSDEIGNTTTLYFQVPVSVGKFFLKEKLLLKIGLVPSFLIQATEINFSSSFSQATNNFEIKEYKDKNAEGFSEVLINTMFQTTFFVTKHIGIDLTYQRSLNSIYSDSQIGKSYYNIFALGASYHFFKKTQ